LQFEQFSPESRQQYCGDRCVLHELIRTAVQRILRDKILLGLIIVAILGVFVGGMTIGDDKEGAKKEAVEQQQPAQAPSAGGQLEPALAASFVSWWLGAAMDYNPSTAAQSHNQAMSWMTPDAARNFQAIFWPPQIAEAVTTGRLAASFQLGGVQAQAVNPDGSVVVGATGTVMMQSNGQAVPQQFLASFLVRQEKDGLRVAGLEPRSGVPGNGM
jgi:hypothetical protein